MSNKEKATPAQGTGNATAPAQADTKVQPINAKLEEIKAKQAYFQKLTDLIQKRETINGHLLMLDNKADSDEFNADLLNNDQDSPKIVTKIKLHFNSDHRDSYDIANAHLLEQVREFLVGKLKSRLAEIEGEITAA